MIAQLFVNSGKPSSSNAWNKPRPPATDSIVREGKRTENVSDDERLQDEYIMEYVRELSLVETRGGGSDVEKSYSAGESGSRIGRFGVYQMSEAMHEYI